MDIKVDSDVYKFLQLINDDVNSDLGTELFVSYLFSMKKLEHVKALFNKEITVRHNEDIPYLVALETMLERFSHQFDLFINENSSKPVSSDKNRDIEAVAKNFIAQMISICQVSVYEDALDNTYQAIVPHLISANEYIATLRAHQYKNGIETNIKDSLSFLANRIWVNFTKKTSKMYFILSKD